ncbi:hypothetical protein [Methylovulum miyakonense]|uniref:hypothetical protein n=1 Tax=Methylovulum miyakonense TaxID=645578 RepID=UPI000372209D|nr:hypothetical protein [Methylovulum miyakonense]
MKTLRNTLKALLATSAIATATCASALPAGWLDSLPAWTATASSCSVDESSAGKYEFWLSQFRYLGSNVSGAGSSPFFLPQPITVRCNVTPIYDYVPANPNVFGSTASWISPSWNSLIVGYKDTDGISTKAQVSAALRKVSRATLGESTVATFNSNLSASVVAHEEVKQFNHTFDFQNYDYYVEINLIRADTTVTTPVAYSVRLTNGYVPVIPK